MSDPWAADHAASVAAGERAVNAVARELAERVVSAVRAEGKAPVTPEMRVRLMRRVEAALDAAYGTERGQPSPMEAAIVAAANGARRRAIRRGFGPVAREIAARHPDLAAVLDARGR